jgi:hypothetical protein
MVPKMWHFSLQLQLIVDYYFVSTNVIWQTTKQVIWKPCFQYPKNFKRMMQGDGARGWCGMIFRKLNFSLARYL